MPDCASKDLAIGSGTGLHSTSLGVYVPMDTTMGSLHRKSDFDLYI